MDEHLPRPPGLEAHLKGCAACRSLARLHTSAASLCLPEPPAPAAIAREEILGVVRRRQHRRRMVASAGATAAVVALVLLVTPHVGTRQPVDDAPGEGVHTEGYVSVEQPTRTAPRRGSEVVSLGVLFDEVHGYTRTDPSVADEMYQPFGALAAWVRPPDNTALDAEPFQSALAAFHVSQSK